MQSSESVTVSRPAIMNRKQTSRISSSVSFSPSTSAAMIRPRRSGAIRSPAALVDHGLEVLVDVLCRLLADGLLLLHGVSREAG